MRVKTRPAHEYLSLYKWEMGYRKLETENHSHVNPSLNVLSATMHLFFFYLFHTSVSFLFFFLLPLLLALVLLFSFFSPLQTFLKWRHHKRLPLPPGSMGWPYIGETLKLYTENPNSFFSNRQKRHGDVFKTRILGCPCVMVSSPEAVKVVLVTRAHLFKPTYPSSKERLIGPEAIFFHQGPYHSRLKRLVQSSFLPSAVRGSVSEIEQIVLRFLPSWNNTTINTLQEMKQFTFDVAILSAFGHKLDPEMEGIKHLYRRVEEGYNSMPVNFPGTSFRRAMKARKLLNETFRRLIAKRRGSGGGGGGLLGNLLEAKEEMELTDSQIADNIIGVIFAAHDTTASILTWLLKYLHDNPPLLQAVTREQEGIKSRKSEQGKAGLLTWDDTRRMPLTTRVIQETLRRASILSFTFREAVEEVELEGYHIPKGWKVLPLFRTIHHSPHFYPHPHKFDPSRFEVTPKPNTYLPFGIGVHACPGSELAKLEMFVLLHHLTTSYRWKVVGGEDSIQYGPFPVPHRGLPIEVTRREENAV